MGPVFNDYGGDIFNFTLSWPWHFCRHHGTFYNNKISTKGRGRKESLAFTYFSSRLQDLAKTHLFHLYYNVFFSCISDVKKGVQNHSLSMGKESLAFTFHHVSICQRSTAARGCVVHRFAHLMNDGLQQISNIACWYLCLLFLQSFASVTNHNTY